MQEYTELHNNGYFYNNKNTQLHFTVTLRCIICDSPARSFVLGIKQFNSYFGCGKCIEEGDFRN